MTAPMLGSRDIAGAVGGLGFAGAFVQFEFKPSIGITAAKIDRLALELESFHDPLTKAVKMVMIPSIAQNFDAEGRPPWQELAEYTVKRRGGETGPILNVSGTLRSDATSLSIWTITPTSASVQRWPQSSWYAQLHQAGFGGFGSSVSAKSAAAALVRSKTKQAAKIHIPARPFIMFQEDDVVQIRAIFFEWLAEKADEVGRLR